MNKKHSQFGFLFSLLFHGSLAAALFGLMNEPKKALITPENTLSMEMVAALLEQPQVAVSAEEEPAPEPEAEPEPVIEPEPEPVAAPIIPPEKPKAKPKEKPKEPKEKPKKEKPKPEKTAEKPKDKPKKEPKEKVVKALEKGAEAKQGIVAKAIPNAKQGTELRDGVANGKKEGSGTINKGAGSGGGEVNAYLLDLRRILQRRAMNSYPQREKMMRKTGTVTISFSIAPDGQVVNVRVAQSSGSKGLDDAAVKAAERTKHSPPPAGLASTITAPINYKLD